MKVLASLRRRTKSGISAWNFCYNAETEQYFAVGGDDLKAIPATSQKHLRAIYENFKRYGYTTKLQSKKQWISDPWDSELTPALQQELELLSA